MEQGIRSLPDSGALSNKKKTIDQDQICNQAFSLPRLQPSNCHDSWVVSRRSPQLHFVQNKQHFPTSVHCSEYNTLILRWLHIHTIERQTVACVRISSHSNLSCLLLSTSESTSVHAGEEKREEGITGSLGMTKDEQVQLQARDKTEPRIRPLVR
jgi:hypothetical protein